MHGCNSGSALLVNAEVDSMGGVIDGGVGIGLKTSPHRAAIEKAQAELRQEYDVREERKRELEFLEKGGNPLDFKFGNAAASFQSTSLTDQQHEQFVTSEAKGSFALTASPHGDSVDSSARPGAPSVSEPNTADNLLVLGIDNELPKGERRSVHQSRRNNVARSEQSSKIDGSQNAKDSEDSAIFRPYARRNRSRTNHGPRGSSRDGKGLVSETGNLKDHNLPSVSKPKPPNINGEAVTKDNISINPLVSRSDGGRAYQTTSGNSVPEVKLDITAKRNCNEDQCTLPSRDDTVQNPVVMASREADAVEERDLVTSAVVEPLPKTTKPESETCSGQLNGIANIKADRKGIANEEQNGDAALGVAIFNSGSSCNQTSVGRDVNNDSDMCNNAKNVNGNGSAVGKMAEFDKKLNLTGCEVKESIKTNASEGGASVNNGNDAGCLNPSGSGNMVKAEEDVCVNSSMENKVSDFSNNKGQNDSTVLKTDKELSDVLADHSNSVRGNSSQRHDQEPMDVSNCELPQAVLAEKVPTAASDLQPCSNHHLLVDKAREDSILEEARIIEAKRKRIAELSSTRTLTTQNQRKSHWGFVLEEMAWLANDFAQERLWKITAAAQFCHRAACTSRLRFEEKNKHRGIKVLAHNIAMAVMQFWHSVELLLDNSDASVNYSGAFSEFEKVDVVEASRNKRRNSDVTNEYLEEQHPRKSVARKVQAYALRFLKHSKPHETSSQAVAPTTPDRISDSGTLGMPWEEHLTEESLFYTVPSTAMEAYQKSVESHFLHVEKTGSSMQEEVETSLYDTALEFGLEDNAYDEDDGETSAYFVPGVYEGSRSSKSAHKRHKNMMKSYPPRSCEFGADLPYGNYTTGSLPSMLIGKRPTSLNVGPITKRMRTASRQRVVSPFAAGVTGTMQPQVKTDASSGDTNSFQDDQSTLHCGSQIQKSVEVESMGEFERQLPYDYAETSVKTKKKKKAKNLGSTYDQGWQLNLVLNEQRDHSKKRLDSHHFDPNGSSGLYAQHIAKKPKTMKLTLDNTFDNIPTMNGSIPSPAASQMSNMPNQSKLIKIISGRDRVHKAKSLKVPDGQPGSGSPWSIFEDQALVVLVHDMGPNWELVSDAINSTLQFKCIFRKPKECKDRHKILMDRSAGDGADSAEDSGSSLSYPSTLPGIPKGSARQLFQRLQGPMEEDTLKSHFENIIKIGQKQYYRRNQNDIQDLKQIVPVHNSHVIAPNNVNGVLLTPLDLCDTNAPTPDALPLGYQGSTSGGLALSNQGSLPSMHPTSGANSSLPGSSGMVLGSNGTSPSGPIPASVRDMRYGVPRTSPLSVDEQQRMQQYNQIMSGRNMQQASMSVPGSLPGNDRGVRMLHGGNGMGMMCGMNRSMSMPRPGLQGMAPSSMLNSENVHSSSMVGMASPVNMHSGVGTGQGNSILRPREGLHMMSRPGHNPEHQRQMMVPELPIQVSQGTSQGIPAFNGLSSAFNNQTSPPPVQPYPGHAQQPHQMSQQQSHLSSSHPHLQATNHATNPQQQALALRLAKERQLQQQQRYLQQQQQQQFASSNTLMPHVQAQSQLPMSSAPQNSSQIHSQNSSQQGVPVSPVTTSQHQQQKHHLPQHGFIRNPGASGLTNQAVKQRQRQPQQPQYQQPGRQHPNPRQHAQSQQQAKLMKGIGRGNTLAHQNIPLDASHLNGLSIPPGSQNAEKGDPVLHVMQGQNSYPESGLTSNQQSKPLPSVHSTSHSQLQQKLHPAATATSSKQPQSIVSADSGAQGPSGHILSSPQPAVITSNHHQMQLQSHPQSKQINQTQSNLQRMIQQSRAVHSESPSKSQSDPTQVDQQPANSALEASMSSVMTQGCNDSANVASAVPTASSQWKTSEPPSGSNMPNPAMQAGSLGGATTGNSAVKESLPQISQGIGSRQSSVNLPPHSQNSGAHWPQQQLPLQQSSSQPILLQQPKPQEQQLQKQQDQEKNSPKHVAFQHQSQQQMQPGQSSLFTRPPNSRVE